MNKEYLKMVKITIRDITKTFLIGQKNVTEKEIINCYKASCEEFGSKVNMNNFLDDISEYGIELIEISENEITHIVL